MLVGHFAVGLASKAIAPKISVGTLTLAAVLADLLTFVLLIAGVEHVRISPGITAVNAIDSYDFAISHSLVTDVIWGGLFAAFYFAYRRDKRAAYVLFGAVASHWVLDFISHRPDMPLAPGLAARFGLGMWNSVAATLLIEGLFWLGAVILYARFTKATRAAGRYVFWAGAALLTLVFVGNLKAPPPPDLATFEWQGLIFFTLVVLWLYWINRLRPART